MNVTAISLGDFIVRSDALGGPGSTACESFWCDCFYTPTFQVDQTLDPFSDTYVEQQLKLYTEISGRTFDQTVNEHTIFDVQGYVDAINPYNHPSPSGLALHLQRLSKAFVAASPPRGGHLLDMGCGWGLSSELGAYLGLNVLAVDINKDFVELVNRRAQRMGNRIRAIQATFDTFVTSEHFDMILFYECFHHALRPWEVAARLTDRLTPEGKMVFVGEPINDYWWRSWGLRLDPLSVYCIRKFGWFESGWSSDFLSRLLIQSGLTVQHFGETNSDVGLVVVGTRAKLGEQSAVEIWNQHGQEGWMKEENHLSSLGFSKLKFDVPAGATKAWVKLRNYRGKPLTLKVTGGGATLFDGVLIEGCSNLDVARPGLYGELVFEGETWSPAAELGTADERTLSFHLEGVAYF